MSRVLTNWNHPRAPKSVLWQIEHAPTIEALTEIMKQAVKANNAAKKTKLKWAAACERREFILKRLPKPKVETTPVQETAPPETV